MKIRSYMIYMYILSVFSKSYPLLTPPLTTPTPSLLVLQTGVLDGGSPMSRVEFKKWSCRMSLSYSCPMSPLRCCHVACRIQEISSVVSLFFLAMSISPMSHVGFKKRLCRRVEFRGQGPSKCTDRVFNC